MAATTTRLKGMTWDHSRGYDPLAATATSYAAAHPGVQIEWEKRSLQAFADFPIGQLAAEYDLIVLDHPHAGQVAREGYLVPLDALGRNAELATLVRQSVGASHETYQYDRHQWALAIDAATQVASYRPDLIESPPTTWPDVIELARQGRVLWPIKPVDSMMSFFTLAANRGAPCCTDAQGPLIRRDDTSVVLEAMLALASHVPPECLSMNPIQTYERMSAPGEERFAYCPLAYGYTNYARSGYRHNLIRFTDIPEWAPGAGPRGSCIGGTGLAISAKCKAIDVAADYAFWVASAAVQKGLYFDAGGQPANTVAWDDEHCNHVAHGFFRDTRTTLDSAYLRPRYDGYLRFQDRGGTVLNQCLAGRITPESACELLEQAYVQSLPP